MLSDRGMMPLMGPRRTLAIASVLLAMAAAVLDASSINIALPAAARSLGISASVAVWLVIGYQAALAASLLPLAAVGERYGYRSTFIAGITLFATCALASSLAANFKLLVAFRVLQGTGGAAIMALGVALLRKIVAPEAFGRVIGWNAMAVAATSAAGPTVGAALLVLGGWRFVFAGGIALAAAALSVAAALPEAGVARREFDRRGALLYVSIAPAFAIAAGIAPARPVVGIALVVLAIAGTIMLVRRDGRRSRPFLPFDLLRQRNFRASVLASVFCFTGLSLALLTLPFALQDRLAASAFDMAKMMTPWPLAVLAMTPLVTSLSRRVDAALLCAMGGLCLAIAMAALALAPAAAGFACHLAAIALCGTGFGLFQTPNNRTMFLAAPIERAASAGGVQGTARLTGQMTGSLIASFLFSAFGASAAIRLAFALAAVSALAAGVTVLRRRNDAEQPVRP